jgi:predicted MFS family arabinose efflux permease
MTEIDDTRARRNVIVLVMAQAILGSQMPMIFIVAGLAGQSLASNVCLATLPISMIIIATMLSATPMSSLMQRWGRRAGFMTGAAFGAVGGAVGAYGLYVASFPLFLLGSLLTGVYFSAHGFYRFAAADMASENYRPKAISYVMAGGLISALLGPQLVKLTSDAYVIPFLGTYFAVIGLNVLGSLLFLGLDIPRPKPVAEDDPKGRSRAELIRDPRIAVAIICAMVSYALMNLVMTSTPLAVVGCGFSKSNAADVVSGHVLAMYAPSFFTGHLIVRFGVERIVGLGLLILAAAGAVALSGVELANFFVALVLLGLGWNFGFIGATTMLANAHAPHERGRMQGLNDLLVFGGVAVASVASGGLMNCSGGSPVEGWTAVNMAMVPFLVLAGGTLIWLVLRPRVATA